MTLRPACDGEKFEVTGATLRTKNSLIGQKHDLSEVFANSFIRECNSKEINNSKIEQFFLAVATRILIEAQFEAICSRLKMSNLYLEVQYKNPQGGTSSKTITLDSGVLPKGEEKKS